MFSAFLDVIWLMIYFTAETVSVPKYKIKYINTTVFLDLKTKPTTQWFPTHTPVVLVPRETFPSDVFKKWQEGGLHILLYLEKL